MTQQLLDRIFRKHFDDPELALSHDGAVIAIGGGELAFSTDSYVVRPIEFPGGDIGKLAVTGTVNDLLMCGARPVCLSLAFVLEEGLELERLERIVASARATADAADVRIVTGDTKVVDATADSGLMICSTGIGLLDGRDAATPRRIAPGDLIVLSGDVGRHGMAVMAAREGLDFEPPLRSDCALLVPALRGLHRAEVDCHCLRDCTRGGLATALIELAESAGVDIHIRETDVPVIDAVRGASEVLGIDPFYVANEGRFIAIVAPDQAEEALAVLREHALGEAPACIGSVRTGTGGVLCTTAIGTERRLHRLSGEQLPRIC